MEDSAKTFKELREASKMYLDAVIADNAAFQHYTDTRIAKDRATLLLTSALRKAFPNEEQKS